MSILFMHQDAIRYSLDPKLPFSKLDDMDEYDIQKAESLQQRMAEQKVWAVTISEADFPAKLLAIRPKVKIIYYMGDLTLLQRRTLGVVWPRLMSLYGEQVLSAMMEEAKDYALVTISGMADGVDRLCHTLSLQRQIPTIAVLGGGLWRYLRRKERSVIQQIVDAGGLVISEFKLGEQPSRYTFPQRNRIIAGLSDALFLPEAGEKSGSLITVDYALAMEIPVYATPGSIFSPTSKGILAYIESGKVRPIIGFRRFLERHFVPADSLLEPWSSIALTASEQHIFSRIASRQGLDFAGLVDAIGGDVDELMQTLTMLELKWAIYQESPGIYGIAKQAERMRGHAP